jgi:hypothetical protein
LFPLPPTPGYHLAAPLALKKGPRAYPKSALTSRHSLLTTYVGGSDEYSRRTWREPIVMVQPVQYRLGHDRSALAQGMPMRPQRRQHTSSRIG